MCRWGSVGWKCRLSVCACFCAYEEAAQRGRSFSAPPRGSRATPVLMLRFYIPASFTLFRVNEWACACVSWGLILASLLCLQGGNSSGVDPVLHSSAASKLKHLQQNSTDKTKSGRREDFLKLQGQHQVCPSYVELRQGPKARFIWRDRSSFETLKKYKKGLHRRGV